MWLKSDKHPLPNSVTFRFSPHQETVFSSHCHSVAYENGFCCAFSIFLLWICVILGKWWEYATKGLILFFILLMYLHIQGRSMMAISSRVLGNVILLLWHKLMSAAGYMFLLIWLCYSWLVVGRILKMFNSRSYEEGEVVGVVRKTGIHCENFGLHYLRCSGVMQSELG